MDGETIRLIVVACGAITAGLGGALIAGAFNSQNTAATIAAAREEAEAQREHERRLEHAQWLRDRKVDVYSKFLEEAHDLHLAMVNLYLGSRKDLDETLARASVVSVMQFRVLSPGPVWLAALRVALSISTLKDALVSIKQRTAPDTAFYDKASKELLEHIMHLEKLCSTDLEIEWADDGLQP
ncbi:hypothetical protein QFZ36_000520 [Pseudarthrobacter siccitolerans]|uniref:Secreted protein n=1 Tax=Pseudarthrobacter siccitolerans TaxID=861266 RepID=A0ABU0PG63_9MICC|nr:hypothetical protein [Pseudarthrobacter siccitolerans]MDQ0672959.1 hypothetical protein [Pseudarthrobacter siccitolerans]